MRIFLLVILLGLAEQLWAAPQVRVVGLFPDAAVVNIDGQRLLLKAGQSGPQGVRLISADSAAAVLEIDGQQHRLGLEREYSQGGYTAPEKQHLIIARGRGGHYWLNSTVNGHSQMFLLDTGASVVALNASQAKRLGIDYKTGRPTRVTTASGVESAWQVTLRSVKVGGIEVLGVEAVVLEGNYPQDALLGMSFLNRIGWRQEQGALILEARY